MHEFAIGDTVYQAAVTTELEGEHYIPLVRAFVVASGLQEVELVDGVEKMPSYLCQLADRPKVKDLIHRDLLFATEEEATAAALTSSNDRLKLEVGGSINHA